MSRRWCCGWLMLFGWVTTHCSSDETTSTAAYASCSADADCGSNTCESDPQGSGKVCTPGCETDADCPDSPSGPALCDLLAERCRAPQCSHDETPETSLQCTDGVLSQCDASSPCSQCADVCGESEYCSPDDECLPKLPDGQPCEESAECGRGVCETVLSWEGDYLYGGQKFCVLEPGTPCWQNDPCTCGPAYLCDTGWLCYEDSECPHGDCVFKSPSSTSGSCEVSCETAGESCNGTGTCEDIGLVTALTEINVCRGPESKPPRPEGWPCEEDTECEGGACCAEVSDAGYRACSGPDGEC